MRCEHRYVGEKVREIRAWTTEDRDDPRCRRSANFELRGKHLCLQHYYIWREHWAVVDRIRAIPCR